MKKTVAFCTGTRAEYGLLKPLMDLILQDPELDFELYVTGMHLSPEFGNTVNLIEADAIPISEKVEILVSGDTPSAVTKSMGLAMIGFADVFARHKPDILILLGDRFEAFCVAAAATVARIPIAHLHGGELTLGAIDDAFRHSITKMSYLHFTSTEEYKNRVIQLGEDPERVFNVGAIGIEIIKTLPLLSKEELEQSLGVILKLPLALITFHPATLDEQKPEDQINELFKALDVFPDLFCVFTKANADAGGRVINKCIDDYVLRNTDRAVAFTSMGQLRYLSVMKLAFVVIGNSSSGIIEAPSFNVPTINIGDRQAGRVQSSSVINCSASGKEIITCIQNVFPGESTAIKTTINPYDKKNTIVEIWTRLHAFLGLGVRAKKFYEGR